MFGPKFRCQFLFQELHFWPENEMLTLHDAAYSLHDFATNRGELRLEVQKSKRRSWLERNDFPRRACLHFHEALLRNASSPNIENKQRFPFHAGYLAATARGLNCANQWRRFSSSSSASSVNC